MCRKWSLLPSIYFILLCMRFANSTVAGVAVLYLWLSTGIGTRIVNYRTRQSSFFLRTRRTRQLVSYPSISIVPGDVLKLLSYPAYPSAGIVPADQYRTRHTRRTRQFKALSYPSTDIGIRYSSGNPMSSFGYRKPLLRL